MAADPHAFFRFHFPGLYVSLFERRGHTFSWVRSLQLVVVTNCGGPGGTGSFWDPTSLRHLVF